MMSQFCGYIDKVFDFGDRVGQLRDSRPKPRIATGTIWRSAFFMFLTHQGSLHAMESELRVPKRWDEVIGSHKPSADRIGDVLGLMDPNDLRAMLSGINHHLGRNKVLPRQEGLRCVVVDGIGETHTKKTSREVKTILLTNTLKLNSAR